MFSTTDNDVEFEQTPPSSRSILDLLQSDVGSEIFHTDIDYAAEILAHSGLLFADQNNRGLWSRDPQGVFKWLLFTRGNSRPRKTNQRSYKDPRRATSPV